MNRGRNQLVALQDAPAPTAALSLPAGLPFEEWCDMGRRLAAGASLINWYLGDWWIAGRHRYGERAKAAAEGILGRRDFRTLRNIGAVCRAFDPTRRRASLTFTHHQEVRALPPQEADALLDRAEAEGLSTRALRRELSSRWEVMSDDDSDDFWFRRIAQAWNCAGFGARMMALQSLEEMGSVTIEEGAELGPIDPM